MSKKPKAAAPSVGGGSVSPQAIGETAAQDTYGMFTPKFGVETAGGPLAPLRYRGGLDLSTGDSTFGVEGSYQGNTPTPDWSAMARYKRQF
jgi:hypothetical protein